MNRGEVSGLDTRHPRPLCEEAELSKVVVFLKEKSVLSIRYLEVNEIGARLFVQDANSARFNEEKLVSLLLLLQISISMEVSLYSYDVLSYSIVHGLHGKDQLAHELEVF
jgi:hypothetical protein